MHVTFHTYSSQAVYAKCVHESSLMGMSLLNGPNNDCKWYAFINTRVSYVCVAYAFTYVHAHTRYLTVSYTGGDTFVNERKSMSNVSSRQHLTPIFLSSFCLWWDYVSPQTGKAIYVCEPILYSSSHTVIYYNCVYNYTILSSNTIQTIRSVSDCFFVYGYLRDVFTRKV